MTFKHSRQQMSSNSNPISLEKFLYQYDCSVGFKPTEFFFRLQKYTKFTFTSPLLPSPPPRYFPVCYAILTINQFICHQTES